MAVLTLLLDRPANPMKIVKFWGAGVRTPKPLNRLTKNLVWVITSVMTPHMPYLVETITTLAAWPHNMHEISPSHGFSCSYPILSFVTPNFVRVPRLTVEPIFMRFASYDVNFGLLYY